jgi:hypothetical protein
VAPAAKRLVYPEFNRDW